MTLVAPRIVNDLPYVSAVNHEPLCGLYVVFIASDNPSISFVHFVCVTVLHPTAQDLRCLVMHDFFSISLLIFYRFMFFFYKLETSVPGLSGYYW